MKINTEFIAVLINSTIRMTSPILLATLAAALCSKVKLFNIALEGAMISGAFFSILANDLTGSVWVSILAGSLGGLAVCAIVGLLVIQFNASEVVAGLIANTLMTASTTYLLYLFFNTKGVYTSLDLVGLPKVSLPFINKLPLLGTILSNLTILDYFAYFSAFGIYIFLYRTVIGFRLRALGINKEAATSMGTPADRYQFLTISISGLLCGLAGCLLSMGTVTLFIEGITSGRGYIALAANAVGQSHPLGVLLSCAFFGVTQALGNVLQNTDLKTQITSSIPYLSTILVLIVYSIYMKWKNNRAKNIRN
jgi:simple sugar transport system permease protein